MVCSRSGASDQLGMSSPAERRLLGQRLSGLKYDLDAAVVLALKQFVGVWGVLERDSVGGEILSAQGVGVTGDEWQDVGDPSLDVGLTHAQGDAFVEHRHHR